jgi:hypothetical protein
VDSEAIFRLMSHYTKNGTEPFTLDILEEVGVRLEGTFTTISMSTNNPYQIALTKEKRPMELVYVKPLQLLIVCSDQKYCDAAFFAFNKASKLYGLGFDELKRGDVLSQMFTENNVGLIDLTVKVDDNTTINDLIDKRDIWKSDKKWRDKKVYGTKTHNNNVNQSTGQNVGGAAAGKKPTTPATSTTSSETTSSVGTGKSTKADEDFEGQVFCKELGKYVDGDQVKEAAKVGAVLISSSTGSVKSYVDTAEGEKEVEVKTRKNGELKKVKADVTVEPEIVEAAKDDELTRGRYRDNKDLSEDLQMVDPGSVEALDPFILANKVRRNICTAAILRGAQIYKNYVLQAGKGILMSSNDKKKSSASVTIRVAKKVIAVLMDMIDGFHSNTEDFQEAVKEYAADHDDGEFTKENLSKLFSEGDRKGNPTVDVFCSMFDEEASDEPKDTGGKVRENGHQQERG